MIMFRSEKRNGSTCAVCSNVVAVVETCPLGGSIRRQSATYHVSTNKLTSLAVVMWLSADARYQRNEESRKNKPPFEKLKRNLSINFTERKSDLQTNVLSAKYVL
jgi:hypothetical protein